MELFSCFFVYIIEKKGGEKMNELSGFRAFLEEEMKAWEVPGAAVAIVKDGEVIFLEGLGLRDIEKNLPVTEETLFAIGSSTKAFTASALALLVDEGKLAWDEPVRTYLPSFKLKDPVASERITPLDLLVHRSGLPRHELVWYGADLSREELIQRIQYLDGNVDFRSEWQYQNLMYLTAGYLAGEVALSSYEALIKKRLFTPLHMKKSNFSIEDMKKSKDYSLPYKEIDGKVTKVPFRNIDEIGPAGSINSNIKEMVNWLKLHLQKGEFEGKRIISEQEIKTLHTPHMSCELMFPTKEVPISTYGGGWFISPYRGHHHIHHGGNIDGFTALVSFLPYENIGVVVLTNKDATFFPDTIVYNIYDRLLHLEEKKWSQELQEKLKDLKATMTGIGEKEEKGKVPNTQPSHLLRDYEGTYHHKGYGNIKITYQDGKLEAALNSFHSELTHYHYDVFQMKIEAFNHTLLLSFQGNVYGEIASLSGPFALEPGTKDIVFEKVPDERLQDKEELIRYIGQYKLQEGILATVSLKKESVLILSLQGQPDYELVPYKKGAFYFKGLDGFSVQFAENEQKEVQRITIVQPNGEFVGEKVNKEKEKVDC